MRILLDSILLGVSGAVVAVTSVAISVVLVKVLIKSYKYFQLMLAVDSKPDPNDPNDERNYYHAEESHFHKGN